MTLFLTIVAGLLAGGVLGMVFFRGLAAEVGFTLGGAVLRGVALHLARFVLAAAVFIVAATHGAVALLAALAGFEMARRRVLHRVRRSP